MISEVVTKKDWHVKILLSNDYQLNFIVEAVTGREAIAEAENVKHLLEVPDDTDLNKEVGSEAKLFSQNTRQVRRIYH